MTSSLPHNYQPLLSDIQRSAQYEALKAVNTQIIALYWDIGRMIVTQQAGETWGKSVVEKLSKDLRAEFTGINGFSSRNIWRMREFYLTYCDNKKLSPLVAEIAWTHNMGILSKCKDDLEREFYIRMTRKMGWSKNVLIHQIENQTYEKTILNQTNFDQTLPKTARNQLNLAIKDEYTFDFLELSDAFNERQLEAAILSQIEPFLIEMGGAFAFIGSQYQLKVGGQDYFVDLLLYHRRLQCLVAIELKIGEFLPEYVGKMQFYLAALNENARLANENPAIGIIRCKSKDRTIVEYALRQSTSPIGVAAYQIVSTLPQSYEDDLPTPEQVAKLLEGITLPDAP